MISCLVGQGYNRQLGRGVRVFWVKVEEEEQTRVEQVVLVVIHKTNHVLNQILTLTLWVSSRKMLCDHHAGQVMTP